MKSLMYLSIVAGLLGFCLVVAGIALISVPAALIVAGSMLIGYAFLADRAAAAAAARAPEMGG